jgi:hypothetical protein
MTRRDWLCLAGQSALVAQENTTSPDPRRSIQKIIRAYEQQGNHRTGTKVDRVSGDWLATEVRRVGLAPVREVFGISRIDLVAASLSVSHRRIQGIPLLDGSFTDPAGIRGRLDLLGSDAAIGLTEAAPNTADTGQVGEARRKNRHRAIVIVTRGGRPGLCPSNADTFRDPFGPPVLQYRATNLLF